MNDAKYRRVSKGEPVRVAKYMFQCLEPNPPRGCDLEAAKRDPPRCVPTLQGLPACTTVLLCSVWTAQLPERDAL
jgi:hypothetical protein